MPYKDPVKRLQRQRERGLLKKAGNWIPKPPVKQAENLVCDNCGKEFYRSPANRGTGGQYCSRKCMADNFKGRFVGEKSPRWRGMGTKPCGNCGQPVTRPIWATARRDQAFCDQKCFGEWKSKNYTGEDNPCWRGGHPPYYGANWIRQSREARRRDGHKCQGCGIDESQLRRALDVHHIMPFRFFKVEEYKKANGLSNLISLCGICHTTAEHLSKYGTISTWSELKPLLVARLNQIKCAESSPSLAREDS